MRTLVVSLLALGAACAGPRPAGRAPLVPPLEIDAPVVRVEPFAPADADRSPPEPLAPSRAQEPSGPVYRSVIETVEVPVERSARAGDGSAAPGIDQAYYDYAYERGWSDARDRRPSPFPINTAIGAGVGAVIGHQSGRRSEGAWIGGGLGLLLDLQRWAR